MLTDKMIESTMREKTAKPCFDRTLGICTVTQLRNCAGGRWFVHVNSEEA